MYSPAARSILLSFGLALGVVACGGSVKDEGKPYSVGAVMSRFKELTGDELVAEGKVLDLRRDGGVRSISLSVPHALRGKYGEFSYIVVWGKPKSLFGRFLDPLLMENRGPTDADGVHWSEGYDELSANPRPYWSAEKIRGNVVLIWFPPSRKKGSTKAFQKLDAVLASLRKQR